MAIKNFAPLPRPHKLTPAHVAEVFQGDRQAVTRQMIRAAQDAALKQEQTTCNAQPANVK